MSVAFLEREASQPQVEVLVDSVDDLRLVHDGLTSIIAEQRVIQRNFPDNTDEHKLEQAELLREQIANGVEATQRGVAVIDLRYTVEDRGLVLEALKAAKQKDQSITQNNVQPKTVQPSSSNTSSAPRLIPHQRITSYFDSRLDEKPRRWFRR